MRVIPDIVKRLSNIYFWGSLRRLFRAAMPLASPFSYSQSREVRMCVDLSAFSDTNAGQVTPSVTRSVNGSRIRPAAQSAAM